MHMHGSKNRVVLGGLSWWAPNWKRRTQIDIYAVNFVHVSNKIS
jgi:hypothetical protein